MGRLELQRERERAVLLYELFIWGTPENRSAETKKYWTSLLRNWFDFSISMVGWLVGFHGISTIVGCLMANPVYSYILDIYDLQT